MVTYYSQDDLGLSFRERRRDEHLRCCRMKAARLKKRLANDRKKSEAEALKITDKIERLEKQIAILAQERPVMRDESQQLILSIPRRAGWAI